MVSFFFPGGIYISLVYFFLSNIYSVNKALITNWKDYFHHSSFSKISRLLGPRKANRPFFILKRRYFSYSTLAVFIFRHSYFSYLTTFFFSGFPRALEPRSVNADAVQHEVETHQRQRLQRTPVRGLDRRLHLGVHRDIPTDVDLQPRIRRRRKRAGGPEVSVECSFYLSRTMNFN